MAAFPSDNNEKTWTEKIVDGLKAAKGKAVEILIDKGLL